MYLLREELLRDDCLKLVTDPQIITALQRDFRLYLAPALDVQTENELVSETGFNISSLISQTPSISFLAQYHTKAINSAIRPLSTQIIQQLKTDIMQIMMIQSVLMENHSYPEKS